MEGKDSAPEVMAATPEAGPTWQNVEPSRKALLQTNGDSRERPAFPSTTTPPPAAKRAEKHMAKVTITIEDKQESGDGSNIDVSMEFTPEIKMEDKPTPAQAFAFELMQKAQKHATASPSFE